MRTGASCHGTLYISLRSDFRNVDAGAAVKAVIGALGSGGGHEMIAGGQIPVGRDSLRLANKLRSQVERNLLDHFKLDPKARRLLVSRAGERRTAKAPKG